MNEEINNKGDMVVCGEIGFVLGMIITVLAEHWFDIIV